MKRLHLICNAHLDPVWMWDYDEGIAAALSTFRTAAEFCDEYDYIFCHNEALLYEFIEKYDPALFEKIRKLVNQGKWHIMGGWYVQPDCHLPSGESFVRQARFGTRYFQEKFGKKATTAINFDSFGHSRGLVQILNKCGYDSYLICRPMPNYLELPSDQFNWIGYDGSKIKVCRIADDFMYDTKLTQAKGFVPKKAECWKEYETGIALWGVGNHGGGPSRIDLKDVNELIENTKDYEMLHSTPEGFFADIAPQTDYDGQLSHFLIGCYSSLNKIKKKHIELETALYMTEKICSVAELNGKKVWDNELFKEAERALLFFEFHDALSGTVVEKAENSLIYQADHALHLLQDMKHKAFFSLINDKPQAKEGEYPIFVFNPSAYERETVVECEILILNSLISDTEYYEVTVSHNGMIIPNQVIKEDSNINYDRRKRIAFKATLPPLSTDRFDVTFKVKPIVESNIKNCGDIVFEDKYKKIVISKKTGLIESYQVNGFEYLSGGAFLPVAFDDTPDSWGWDIERIGENPVEASLDNTGIFEGIENVQIIEQGDILTEVESFFKIGESRIRMSYKLYKDLPYIDVKADVLWNEREKALKLKIPSKFGEFCGQTAYGTDYFERDGRENVAQRFMVLRNEDISFSIFNDCIYGCSADKENIYLTLLRGIGYCVHPIEDRKLIDTDRYIPYAEQGKHTFCFRLSVNEISQTDRLAKEFCEVPYSLNAFPAGNGSKEMMIKIDGSAISLHAFYKENEKYILRLFNNNDNCQEASIYIGTLKYEVKFSNYEIKTLCFENGELTEKEQCFD